MRKHKNPHAVALGRLGGKVRSRRKTLAGRINAARMRRFLLTECLCRICKTHRLAARNRSGICRVCQRSGVRFLAAADRLVRAAGNTRRFLDVIPKSRGK